MATNYEKLISVRAFAFLDIIKHEDINCCHLQLYFIIGVYVDRFGRVIKEIETKIRFLVGLGRLQKKSYMRLVNPQNLNSST